MRTRQTGHREDDAELVASDPGDGVDGSADPADPRAGLDERRVPGGMAAGVVERPEQIDVDDQQAERLTVSQGAVHLDAQTVVERAVAQASGERIGACLTVEPPDEQVLVAFEP